MKRINSLFLILWSVLLLIPACTSDKVEEDKDQGPLIVTARLRADPDRLNPIMTGRSEGLQICYKIFPSLLQHDPFTLKLAPMLAKALPEKAALAAGEYDGDATHKYIFEILDEAVWDNGQPVLASDYAFTLKAVFNPKVTGTAPYRGLLNFIKDIKIDAENPKKFTLYVKGSFRTDPGSGFYIMPEYVYDAEGIMRNFELKDLTHADRLKKIEGDERLKTYGDQMMDPKFSRETVVSCGAYKFVKWEPKQEIVLEKKENWWGDKLANKQPMLSAYPDKLVYKIVPDETAAIAALKDGKLDIMAKMTPAGFNDFKSSNMAEGFNFHNPEIIGYMYMGFNTKKPKLSDKRVRRAIAHLTDVDKIIESVQLGYAKPVITPFPVLPEFSDADLKRIDFNIDKAKALLAEAGWKDSNGDGVVDKMINGSREELVVKILTTKCATSKGVATLIIEGAKKAGVKVEQDVVDGRTLFGNLAKREFDAWFALSAFDQDEFDPSQGWHTDSDNPNGYNRVGFGNAETDAIIDEIKSTSDRDRRKELYLKLQKIIYDEQPILMLYAAKDRIVVNSRLKNAVMSQRSPNYFENYFQQ